MNANNFKNPKVALVHDFLNQYGGAERVLEAIHGIFPDAPIYTLLYDPQKMRGKFKDADIRPSFLQKFPKFLPKLFLSLKMADPVQWLLILLKTPN